MNKNPTVKEFCTNTQASKVVNIPSAKMSPDNTVVLPTAQELGPLIGIKRTNYFQRGEDIAIGTYTHGNNIVKQQ